MNPIILPPAMGKFLGRLGSSALVRQLVLEKENSEFKPVKNPFKNWPCVISCPSRRVGKYDITLHGLFDGKVIHVDEQ